MSVLGRSLAVGREADDTAYECKRLHDICPIFISKDKHKIAKIVVITKVSRVFLMVA